MNIFKAPLYHIYLLQLENFNVTRVLRVGWRDVFSSPQELRNHVTWTKKLTLVVSLAVLVGFIVSVGFGWGVSSLVSTHLPSWPGTALGVATGVILLTTVHQLFFLLLATATLLIRPLDRVVRRFVIHRARQRLAAYGEDLDVVAITGSYGKTTMKQTLDTMLSGRLSVIATQESHNTPVAIARTILSDITNDTDVFIVEMGAYHRGDIQELCKIVQPNISILTGINEAHLERFGSLKNTIQAKFEIVTATSEDTEVILNADDQTVMNHYKDFADDRDVSFYSSENAHRTKYQVKDKRFHQDGTGISFRLYEEGEELGYVKIPHLGNYIVGNVMAGVLVGETTGLEAKEVLKKAHKITPADHRLQPIQRTHSGILVIDDSYNGNPDGAHAAIDVLENFADRRTIYVTPGLVEMGSEAKAVHKSIGEHLAKTVDVVVLVETSVTDWIQEGLSAAGFSGELITFESPQEMHQQISDVTKSGDVLLFQNDWPENYQ